MGLKEVGDSYLVGEGESQNAWEHFLNKLYYRGLEGKHLRLGRIDGNKGLRNAIKLVYPGVDKERLWAHKLRNVANKIPKKLQKLCINGARNIYGAESYKEAVWNFKKSARIWRPVVPKAVEFLKEEIKELVTCFACPVEDWKRLRSPRLLNGSSGK
ncbi:MAG: transposase [bacterium]